jgi:exonuclease III
MVKYRGIKLVHQNICSLLRRLDELRLMCNVLKSGIHMITLSETWLTSEIPDIEIEIDGYRVFRKNRDSRGGGVLAYVRNDLFVVRRADLETPSVEGMWLEISLPKVRGFLVGIFYTPPDSSAYHDKDFMLKLNDMLDMALEQDREVIITGDFNCDFMAKREVSSECKWLKHILRTQYFSQIIQAATRVTNSSKTLLDIIATNYPQNISLSGVVSANMSDHELVYCVIHNYS